MINEQIYRILIALGRRRLLKWMPDKTYIKLCYKAIYGKSLDLENPITFNEKLQWLKLYDRNPEYTILVDKYRVKEYIADTLGSEHLIKTIGVWKNANDISFDELPNAFVLKCNHDSAGIVICKDKNTLNKKNAIAKLEKCLKRNGFWFGREWPYKNVPPCIIAEPYKEDYKGKGELTDYKLHFFSGECKAIMVGQNRFGINGLENDFYTPEWEHFDLRRGHSHNSDELAPRPEQLPEMIRLGKILAKELPFVRIDFYIIDGEVYFGEFTLYPGSGFHPFYGGSPSGDLGQG